MVNRFATSDKSIYSRIHTDKKFLISILYKDDYHMCLCNLVKKPINLRVSEITNVKLFNEQPWFLRSYSLQHLKYVHWGKGGQRQILPLIPLKKDWVPNNFRLIRGRDKPAQTKDLSNLSQLVYSGKEFTLGLKDIPFRVLPGFTEPSV